MYKKGKRIRARDKNLVFNFFSALIISTYALAFLLLQSVNIIRRLASLAAGRMSVGDIFRGFQVTPFFIFCTLISFVFAGGAALAFYYFQKVKFKQLEHRQKLAEMVIENNWCDMESAKDSSFFKDWPGNDREKKKITKFPKLYYKFKNNQIKVLVKISMGKNQDALLKLEKKLESGLFCECVQKELKESYIEYTLLYNLYENRIDIHEMVVKDNTMKLMKNLHWKINKQPHMLITGGTGSGKTYFILALITSLAKSNAVLSILDPKNADLSDLSAVLPNVYSDKEDIIKSILQFESGMVQQSEDMKRHPGYKTGEDYAYLGLPPHFLVFDEFIAFMAMLDRKQFETVTSALMRVAMLGRQAGYFLILACQRPDSKYFGDGVRDQFNYRIALGRVSDLGYTMLFGENEKEFYLKDIKGRGYVDSGIGVISEFYTPYVPEGYDFMQELYQITHGQEVEDHAVA